MNSPRKSLGVMRPLGGGDEIPLKKEELIIGRRPNCDIQLDFENISGKHCLLKFVRGTWHVRDLGSSNGTTVNGQKISSEHGLLSDDELGIAGHFFALDYDAAAPTSLMDANMILEEEMTESPRQHSLMELAGLEGHPDPAVQEQVEIQIKYEGYIHRQSHEVDNFKRLESRRIPCDFDYACVKGFSHEVLEKLQKVRPCSLGQASRIEGVTPAAVSLLQVALERSRRN